MVKSTSGQALSPCLLYGSVGIRIGNLDNGQDRSRFLCSTPRIIAGARRCKEEREREREEFLFSDRAAIVKNTPWD